LSPGCGYPPGSLEPGHEFQRTARLPRRALALLRLPRVRTSPPGARWAGKRDRPRSPRGSVCALHTRVSATRAPPSGPVTSFIGCRPTGRAATPRPGGAGSSPVCIQSSCG
jgi:hypothetical protein